MEEIWRSVVGYEGLYEVSNYGRVRSVDKHKRIRSGSTCLLKGRILKQLDNGNGYKYVHLFKDNKSQNRTIHRLVAQAFPEICGEWFEGCDVNHKDENPSNNKADNLETCTRQYNMNYGTGNKRRGKSHSKPVNQYTLDGQFIKTWNSAFQVKKELKIHCVSDCCYGKQETAGGFKWKFAK